MTVRTAVLISLLLNLPGIKDVNCRQLCLNKYQMPVFLSNPRARIDSVDAITGIGIVVDPSGFRSFLSIDKNIILRTLSICGVLRVWV